jgi:hypothetical protein
MLNNRSDICHSLLFLSGMPTAEKPTAKKFFLMSHSQTSSSADGGSTWQNYKTYLRETSALIPLPRTLYRPLPRAVKTWLLFDLPIYQFDEGKDGKEAVEEERRKQRESNEQQA